MRAKQSSEKPMSSFPRRSVSNVPGVKPPERPHWLYNGERGADYMRKASDSAVTRKHQNPSDTRPSQLFRSGERKGR
jgi:hypothetical protein